MITKTNTNPNFASSSPPIKTGSLCIKPLPRIPDLAPPVNAATLLADVNQVEPAEIVVGLIQAGTKVVLGGSSKAGKTWLLLYLALCVASGTKFLRWGTKKGRVLFLNFELQSSQITKRLRALTKQLNIDDLCNLVIWNLRGQISDLDAVMQQILKAAESGEYSMIILDPIYKLMAGKSENMAGGVGMLCQKLERIAERTGAVVVYAHHFTKGNQKNKKPIDRLSGSGVFARDADTIMLFTEHNEPNCFTVEMVLRNLPPQESFVVEWQYPVMVEREDLEPEGEGNPGDARARQMLTLLVGSPLTTGEWEAAALLDGIPHASFFRTKGELKDGGHITFNTLDKTWSVAPGLVETGDTPDTGETGETAANSGGIKGIAVSPQRTDTETKLLVEPDRGASAT
jgi:AAA domain